jgi:hypothetical protein
MMLKIQAMNLNSSLLKQLCFANDESKDLTGSILQKK